MKVVFVGYMGSGKSLVGKLLAKKLEVPFYDLDAIIEEIEHQSIPELFETKGEIYFRKIESNTFRDFMVSEENYVLALGGGTPCYANNHELLQKDEVMSIYLKASIDELYNRLSMDNVNRPLVNKLSKEDAKEFIGKHLFERSYYYNQAKKVVNVDGKSRDDLVLEISTLI